MRSLNSRSWRSFARSTSVFAFGTWAIGGESSFAGHVNGWGPADRGESLRALRCAFDMGMNLFDTADIYGGGLSEELLGEALDGEKGWTVITKFGNREMSVGAGKDFSADWMRECVRQSLKRLRRDHIDVLLLHSPADDFDWKSFDPEPYEKLRRDGTIGAYGVSVRSHKGALNVFRSNFGSVIEVGYNCLDRRIEDELLPALERTGKFDVLGRVPLASGFLSGKYAKAEDFSPSDFRSKIKPEDIAWRIEAVRSLDFLNDLPGGIVVSALRFALSASALTAVIVGLRSTSQVQVCHRAIELGPLPQDVIERIAAAVPEVFEGWR